MIPHDPAATRSFRAVACTGAAVLVDGHESPVVYDLAGMTLGKSPLPCTLGHVSSRLIGHALDVVIVPAGILCRGHVWLDTPQARVIHAMHAEGRQWQCSIVVEFAKMALEIVPAGSSVVVNEREFQGPVEIVREARVVELGFTLTPADPETLVVLEDERPGALAELLEKLRLCGQYEPCRLLEVWGSLRCDAQERVVDVVLAEFPNEPAVDPSTARHARFVSQAIERLRASGELARALLFHKWSALTEEAQGRILDIMRDDLAPTKPNEREEGADRR